MLRKLRIKFICVNMLIVTMMLLVIFGLVFKFTQANLEQQSVSMMEAAGGGPLSAESAGRAAGGHTAALFCPAAGRSRDLVSRYRRLLRF